MQSPGTALRRGISGALVRPLNLALLAAGGLAGALVHWPLAGAGLVAYIAGVAIAATRTSTTAKSSALAPPQFKRVDVRSTEVMALVVRIRKGHAAFYALMRDGDDGVRALFGDSYARMSEVVEHAYALAHKADKLRAHLDRAPAGGDDQRAAMRGEYDRLAAQLGQLGSLLENWHGRVLNASTRVSSDASSDASELGEALSHMDTEVRVLTESVRV